MNAMLALGRLHRTSLNGLPPPPLGFDAGDQNLYQYVGNRPTTASDPWGLRTSLTDPPILTPIVRTPIRLPANEEECRARLDELQDQLKGVRESLESLNKSLAASI